MNTCICCSSQLLRHICHHSVYWYCPRCRQAMPVLETATTSFHREFELRKSLHTVLSEQILISHP